MRKDDKAKQDLASKRHLRASLGARTLHYIAGTGHHFTPDEARVAVQKRDMVQRLKREQQENQLSIGTLRQWHWRAMATAWKARPQGVKATSGLHADYGNIAQKVWIGLRDYEDGALVETYETLDLPFTYASYTSRTFWIRLTSFGEQYYRNNWQRYHDLYPDVDAPAPREPDQNT